MLVKYSPENGKPEEWEFDPNRVRQSEAEMIEKRMGGTYQDWVRLIQAGDTRARRVLLWHLRRREHHTARFEDTPDFLFGELELDYSLADLQKIRQQMVDSSLSDDEKGEIIDRLDIEIAMRLGKEEVGPEDMGKAHLNADG
jgi:hypothetical protein